MTYLGFRAPPLRRRARHRSRSPRPISQIERLEDRRLLAADLRPIAVEAPVGVVRGGYASIVSRVVNEGDAAAGYYSVAFYASRDAEITTADTLLTTVGRYPLGAGAALLSTDNIYIPPAFATGEWRIGVLVDVTRAVAELNEANNALAAARTIEIAAAPVIDLVAVQVDAPPVVARGTTIVVPTTVENRGWSPSGSYRIDYVLSSNDTIGAADLVLKSVTRAGLDGGARQSWNESITIPTNLASGTYRLGIVVDPLNAVLERNESNNLVAASIATTVPVPAATEPGFRVTFSFTGFTTAQRAIFRDAADRWSEIIRADLPDVVVNGLLIDDLRIVATSVVIDGANNVLGDARATGFRSGTAIPFAGVMRLDTADIDLLESRGKLLAVVMHEIGHLLGLGAIWGMRGLVAGAGGATPTFLGKQATAAYNELFGAAAAGVPVEGNNSGLGSRDVHWRESVFDNELMTPRLNGSTNPISRVTVASLADLGYIVDLAAADPFAPPATTVALAAGPGGGTGGAALVDGDGGEPANSGSPWDDEVCWCPHCAPRPVASLPSGDAEPSVRNTVGVESRAASSLSTPHTASAISPSAIPLADSRSVKLLEALARRLNLDTECRNRAHAGAAAVAESSSDRVQAVDVATDPETVAPTGEEPPAITLSSHAAAVANAATFATSAFVPDSHALDHALAD